MKNIFQIIFLAILLGSCSSTKKLPQIQSDQIAFSIAKGPCFGKCPIYYMAIYGNGHLRYEGDRHTEKVGVYTKQLTDEAFNELKTKIYAIEYLNFPDEYPVNIPDLPMVTLKLNDGKIVKEIKGKDGRDKEVVTIERILESIANSEGWTAIDEPTAEDKRRANLIFTEIIIEPSAGTLLPNWIRKMQKPYGVRLIEKIGNNNGLWLIAYDPRKIEAEKMLNIIRNDKGIKFAEFNKKVKNRSGNN